MEFLLVVQICSILSGECMPPQSNESQLYSWSECVTAGGEATIEIANKDVKIFDEHKLMIKYWCSENISNKTPT